MAAIVVHGANAHEHHRHVTPFTQDQFLRRDFRLGISPFRFERPIFVDTRSWFAGRVDKHGARKYELLDLKIAQPMQQPLGATHVYLLV